jgi:hypothetical protein
MAIARSQETPEAPDSGRRVRSGLAHVLQSMCRSGAPEAAPISYWKREHSNLSFQYEMPPYNTMINYTQTPLCVNPVDRPQSDITVVTSGRLLGHTKDWAQKTGVWGLHRYDSACGVRPGYAKFSCSGRLLTRTPPCRRALPARQIAQTFM